MAVSTINIGDLYCWDSRLSLQKPYGLPAETPFVILEADPCTRSYGMPTAYYKLMTITGEQKTFTETQDCLKALINPLTTTDNLP